MNVRPDDATVAALVERAMCSRTGRSLRCRAVEVVDDKPGQRAVLRAVLDPPEPPSVFVKWSVDAERGARNHTSLVALHGSLADIADAPRLPEPLVFLADESLQILGHVTGTTLATIIGQYGGKLPEPLAVRLGRALAVFHNCGATLPARYHVPDEIRTTRQWIAEMASSGAPVPLVAQYESAVEHLAGALLPLRLRDDAIVHRDLHEEHCMFTDDGAVPGLIDLDEARHGDPVIDLGHLAVHLQLRVGCRDTLLAAGPAAGVLAAWGAVTGELPDPRCLQIAGALACIKIARQRVTGFGTAPRPSSDGRWRAAAEALDLASALLDIS